MVVVGKFQRRLVRTKTSLHLTSFCFVSADCYTIYNTTIILSHKRHDEKHCSVAIQSVKTGKYLSCRRASIATRFNSAFAEFRKKRGHFETFTMIILPEDGCVIFKSHNSLFLAINDTFHSCEFKSCSSRDEFGMPEKGRWTIIAKPDGRVGMRNTAASIARSFGATGQLAWGIIWFFVDPLGALQEAGTFVPRLGSE